MNDTFALILLDGTTAVRVDGVTSLVAADDSGQFGIQPGHAPLVSVLEPGLFRYRVRPQEWTYAACAGGLLRCSRNGGATQVQIVSRRFVRDEQPLRLQARLDALLAAEATLRVSTRDSRDRIEQALQDRLRRLAEQTP